MGLFQYVLLEEHLHALQQDLLPQRTRGEYIKSHPPSGGSRRVIDPGANLIWDMEILQPHLHSPNPSRAMAGAKQQSLIAPTSSQVKFDQG